MAIVAQIFVLEFYPIPILRFITKITLLGNIIMQSNILFFSRLVNVAATWLPI
jgi:hypothetical protein